MIKMNAYNDQITHSNQLVILKYLGVNLLYMCHRDCQCVNM